MTIDSLYGNLFAEYISDTDERREINLWQRLTSAYANKVLRKLQEDKEFWLSKERDGYVYVAAIDEEPVIPEYDYETVAAHIVEIDEKIVAIKHAINVVNATNVIIAGDKSMTIDALLVRMAQSNKRKDMLDKMRKTQPKTRVSSGMFSVRKSAPEYQYINYDMDLIKKDYELIDAEIAAMQIALDKFNQTFEFEVEV